MLIDVSYDFLVELHFLFTGRFPLQLMEQIRNDRLSIYEGLGPDVGRASMLAGTRTYEIEDRSFVVIFASDTQLDDHIADTRQLRVLQINELH